MPADIKQLIPQRSPIMMVDELLSTDGDKATTSLVITGSNYFLASDNTMEETGLMEHIAQSASAFAGQRALLNGATQPPVGYIGEIKKFRCYRRPSVGEKLMTTVVMGTEVDGVSLLTAQTCVGNETIADTQMKIFIER